MIIFNTLKFEGFQGQEEFKVFKLDQLGLNVITGKNGCGKSTIFNALAWALYGKPLKEKATIDTWEHKRGANYQGTMVTLSVLIGQDKYKITRCKDYKGTILGTAGRSRLVFEKNGEIYPRDIKDKRDIQRAITEILGMSYELFINTVIFPQRVTRFIEAGGADKKKILEESFSLGWLNDMAGMAKEKRLDLDSIISSIRIKRDDTQVSLKDIQDMLDEIETNKTEFETEKAEASQAINKSITELEKASGSKIKAYDHLKKSMDQLESRQEILEKDKLVTEFEATEKEVQDLIPKRDAAQRKLDVAVATLARLRKSSKCPECGQEIPQTDRLKHRRQHQSDKEKYSGQVIDFVAQLRPLQEDLINGKKVRGELKDITINLKSFRKQWDEKETERLKVEGAKGQLLELRKRLIAEEAREFKDLSPPLKRKQYTSEIELSKYEAKLKGLERRRKMYSWVINVPLSQSGIKAFLFDNLLKALNNRVKYYERFTGLGVELEVDMHGARKDINTIVIKDEYPVSYDDLSGGESQLVNTVMALGQNDILTVDNPSNLYVMDEVFEGLDPDNIDIVGALLADKAKDRSLFVITHNNAFIPQNANLIRMSNGK